MSFCLWLPDVISYPIHPTHVEILNLSHKSQSHVLSDKQMLIKATCIVLQGKQDDHKCENVRHVSYLNTISKQNRIKHRNRFQMLVRTCFLVDCLFLTSSIALKIVLFFKKNQYIDNVSDIPLMSLKVSWMSFLDYLLIKVTMRTIHFIVSFIELQKCQTKKSLEWRIPYNYAPLWSQSSSGSLSIQYHEPTNQPTWLTSEGLEVTAVPVQMSKFTK